MSKLRLTIGADTFEAEGDEASVSIAADKFREAALLLQTRRARRELAELDDRLRPLLRARQELRAWLKAHGVPENAPASAEQSHREAAC